MEAWYLIITTTPSIVHNHLSLSMIAQEVFKTLQALFEKTTTTATTVPDNCTQRTANDKACTSNRVRNGSGRQQKGSLSKKTNGMGKKKGKTLRGRIDEAATATGPGMKTSDHQWTRDISLTTPVSSP
jgi:hypothetical protein